MIKKNQIQHWLRRLQVQEKIAWGYGLSLGIAIAGTSLGIILADRQQQQAALMGKDALEELELITRLQVDVLQTFIEHKQVKESLANPVHLPKYYAEWQNHHNRFRQSWKKFKKTEGGTKGQHDIEGEGEVEALHDFFAKYDGVPEADIEALDRLLSNSEPTAFTPDELVRLKTG